MKIIFIRHGEPDYSHVAKRGFVGLGLNLAHLSKEGEAQATAAAEDARLDGARLILASPYARALHTAAIISRRRNLPIEVELDLHEWLPDLTFTYKTDEEVVRAGKMLLANKGICPPDSLLKYEELESVFTRANAVLQKYQEYGKIIVVAHAILIRQFAFASKIPYCGISEVEWNESFTWSGWVSEDRP